MARLTPLSTLLRMLKAALGDSLTVGSQSDALYKQLLSDKQQWLAGEFDFPFLKDQWDKVANPGDRYLDFPTTTIDGTTGIAIEFERPVQVVVNWVSRWQELMYGIDPMTEYNYLNSDSNVAGWSQQRNDPIQRWQFNGESQFEIWPLPNTLQTVRFIGQRVLNPLVSDSDTADLDDEFLVLSTAVDLLMKKKGNDAQIKLSAAQGRLRSLRACYPCRTREVVLGGNIRDRSWRRRVPIIGIQGSSGSSGNSGGNAIGIG